ncbi:MAG TPA: transposase [Algoriphagus sp.]|jgi:REP element-mobilizing transposase RayT|uniref:transposase n=3 Tax=Algoriphagus TaxID=246875 RepID=UPI000C4558E7|nr:MULTISPECIES: transposase [unclassified Algoriphagus]MAL12521.1 transposase [Algoriphagus sp.]MAN87496.1 transposase [Algoriphagus sp.]HCD86886.1 transposase [Algoriphagus sp.]|tara:strand:- start:273 stop:725 length:453 start_codon:yes stop_codon:yes gene_type:complete
MAGTFTKQIIHAIFSTKDRQKLILPKYELELFSYIAGILKQQNCAPISVGGYLDHVHVLFHLSSTLSLSAVMEHLKTHSSKFAKGMGPEMKNFYWQFGFGAFSVNPKETQKVVEYIRNQKVHHKTRTFQEEFIRFLNSYEIEFDEKYIWR